MGGVCPHVHGTLISPQSALAGRSGCSYRAPLPQASFSAEAIRLQLRPGPARDSIASLRRIRVFPCLVKPDETDRPVETNWHLFRSVQPRSVPFD